MAQTQYGLPLIVNNFSEITARGLNRIRFEKGSDRSGYKERWLQELVSRYPNALPIGQIEPALVDAVSICMELPVRSGFVDNLFATPDGDLIVGETKLFRNPEARREVVGQIIEYAKDLSALSYEQLEEAIGRAEAPDGAGGHPKLGLYQAVASMTGSEEIIEEQFIDSVSRNLERGRFLLLVIGDGIQEGAESLARFLQQHAGMHFTLGIVELAIFELPHDVGGYLVQPRILARTVNIDRGIVTIENGKMEVKPPREQSNGRPRATTISEEKFYEELSSTYPDTDRLKAFASRLDVVGVQVEFGKNSMKLKWGPDGQSNLNLATILTAGQVWTDVLNRQMNDIGRVDLSHAYLSRIASSVPGASVKKFAKPTGWYVAKNGRAITIDELLTQEGHWLAAIQAFITETTHALKTP